MKKSLSRDMKAQTETLAKLITLHCVRNTGLEGLHRGTTPSSQTGDYSDVKVVTPYGEIPWKQLSRISDEEMKTLVKEVVNKIFTFLLYFDDEPDMLAKMRQAVLAEGFENDPGQILTRMWFPSSWDPAQVDGDLKQFLPQINGAWTALSEQRDPRKKTKPK
jgi:hypothetical protein